MDNDLINSTTQGPIVRSSPSQRLATFQANANSIYNKYTPFVSNGIGPAQPFVYTKISDSSVSRNLTKYDSQAAPIGSTVRDLQRIGKFTVTGAGLLFNAKQLLLQNTNAFNETRIFNPLSILKATAKPGSLGLIDYPIRHLETSGGLLNFFKDALLSTIGYQTKDSEKPRIDGTATGVGGVAYSVYAGKMGGARAGLLRFGTANAASAKFNEIWVSTKGTNKGGFLESLGSVLVNKLKSLIPSTNPMGAFGGNTGTTWTYRPEYTSDPKAGIYYKFLEDRSGFLSVTSGPRVAFYNDGNSQGTANNKAVVSSGANAAKATGNLGVSTFHKYYPAKEDPKDKSTWYASPIAMSSDKVGYTDFTVSTTSTGDSAVYRDNLKDTYAKMLEVIGPDNEGTQFKKSAERYSEVKDYNGKSYPVYKQIPDRTNIKNNEEKFYVKMDRIGSIEKSNWFAKASGITKSNMGFYEVEKDSHDRYNALQLKDLSGNGINRQNLPYNITGESENQSRDLIYFYFYDLVNKVYIPFRATITGLSDQNSADWEPISYLGRADKLFLYSGFTRDVNLNFTVYANSIKEMLPMWNRVNYLVGLTRPSKYTGQATVTNEDATSATSGKESRFIYPPMTTFRIGDVFVDQPCVISSVSVTIPDDTNWETLRDDTYTYDASTTTQIRFDGVNSRQLPMKVDVSMALKIMEKQRALGSNAHYGKSSYDENGVETGKWLL